jgi:hypothetical protein
MTPLRTLSLACPAVPTCGLALCESERALPGLVEQLEAELDRLGLKDERIALRVTGCPNGCARPYQSDIGVVGRSGDKYTLFVGGNVLGNRLSFTLRDLVPIGQIVPTLVPLLQHFKQQRQPSEGFGDFCHRLGQEALDKLLPAVTGKPKAEEPPAAVNGAPVPKTPALAAQPTAAAAVAAKPSNETYYAGPAGEELRDYTYRYGTDGSVRETVVYFYGDDLRASQAHPGLPLVREAVYQGEAKPYRLHAARKRSDTFFAGQAGQELRDYRLDYHTDSRPAQTVIYFYDGNARAKQAPSGASLRRSEQRPVNSGP